MDYRTLLEMAVVQSAFDLWVESTEPTIKSMSIRERNIALSAFRCAWEARGIRDSAAAAMADKGE